MTQEESLRLLEAREHELRERVKELHCLARLNELQSQETTVEDLLRQAVALLPPAWQFSDDCVARIRYLEQVFQTGDLDRCPSVMKQSLKFDGACVGELAVGYLEPHPFLSEEHTLLDIVCQALSRSGVRLAAEASLRRSEERYRLLADNTLDVIWEMDMSLQVTYVNPAITRLTGYTPEEYIGSNLQDHCSASVFGELLAVLEAQMARGPHQQGVILETELLRADGTPVPVEVHGKIRFDDQGQPVAIQGTSRDVSERKQARQALQESEDRYRTLFETMAQGVIFLDAQARIIAANPAAEQILGVPLAQLLGRTPHLPEWRAVHPDGSDFPAAEHPALIALLEGREVRDVVMGVAHPGEREHRWIKVSAAPQFRSGEQLPYQVFISFEDITALRRAEAQLSQAQKLEAVGRLAGGVAHDFNNMLGVILGNAQLALEELEPGAPFYEEFDEILKAGTRSAALTRQLLAFARKQTIAPRPLDLNDAVAGMLKMLGRLIGEDIDFIWKPGHELPPVKMDPAQLDQMLANLVVNARDAIREARGDAPGDTGCITIETARVFLDQDSQPPPAAAAAGDYVTLSVTDTGAGIDDHTLANIFEPFFTTKPEGSGTGLGLAMVHGIASQNHGCVRVESELGRGSTFASICLRWRPRIQLAGPTSKRPRPSGVERRCYWSKMSPRFCAWLLACSRDWATT